MGLLRFELRTSPLSGVRSNQLSYKPAQSLLSRFGEERIRLYFQTILAIDPSESRALCCVSPHLPNPAPLPAIAAMGCSRYRPGCFEERDGGRAELHPALWGSISLERR